LSSPAPKARVTSLARLEAGAVTWMVSVWVGPGLICLIDGRLTVNVHAIVVSTRVRIAMMGKCLRDMENLLILVMVFDLFT
jgi:hypothetical protein